MAYLVIFIIVWLILVSFKKTYFFNKFISEHKKQKKEALEYKCYLRYCEMNGEIPLHFWDFKNEVYKNKKSFEELMK